MATRKTWLVHSGVADDYSEETVAFMSQKKAEAYARDLLRSRGYEVEDDVEGDYLDDRLGDFSGSSSDGEEISIEETTIR